MYVCSRCDLEHAGLINVLWADPKMNVLWQNVIQYINHMLLSRIGATILALNSVDCKPHQRCAASASFEARKVVCQFAAEHGLDQVYSGVMWLEGG